MEEIPIAVETSTTGQMSELMTNVMQLLGEQQVMMRCLVQKLEGEKRVEGILIPHYSGNIGELLSLFLDQARLFFEAKNIADDRPENQRRVLAMMISNLRGQAASCS